MRIFSLTREKMLLQKKVFLSGVKKPTGKLVGNSEKNFRGTMQDPVSRAKEEPFTKHKIKRSVDFQTSLVIYFSGSIS